MPETDKDKMSKLYPADIVVIFYALGISEFAV